MTIAALLLIIALICFILAAFGVATDRINLIALGLAFYVGSLLVGGATLAA